MAHGLVHYALLYDERDEYVETLSEFVRAGIEAGEPVLIAVPAPNLELLRRALPHVSGVAFANMAEVGRNPARILAVIADFFSRHAGKRVRLVAEPIWQGRTACEAVEGMRHEALINPAFDSTAGTIVCPYDSSRLDAGVIADAGRTHPQLSHAGRTLRSATYAPPLDVYAARDRPLPSPARPVAVVPLPGCLESLRRWVVAQVPPNRLSADRLAALVLATNEAVSNTIVHAGGRGTVRAWHDDDEIVCEVSDRGRIDDPFAGRRAPRPGQESGRGLWLVNQLCDLAELRSGAEGTVLRLHMTFA